MRRNPLCWLMLLAAFAFSSCSKEEEKQFPLEDLFGSYEGKGYDGSVAHNFHILPHEEDDFLIQDLGGITWPWISVSGKLKGRKLLLRDHECLNCPGLPSPGGFPRYYDSYMTGSGIWYPEQDSMVLFIDYELTGFTSYSFVGEVYLKKKN